MPPIPTRLDGQTSARRHFRYFDYMMAAFVTILLLSNLISAAKQVVITLPGIGAWHYGAGVLFFPVSDLPPAGPAIITRVRRFDIRPAPPAQARRVGRFHLAGTPGALELV